MTTHSIGDVAVEQAVSYISSEHANQYNPSEGKFGCVWLLNT